jgi:hypothetical protein
MLLVTALFLLPVLVLHIQFWVENRKMTLIIDKRQKQLLFQKKTFQHTYSYSDIECIEMYLAPARYFRNGFLNLPFDPYYYANIKLKNGGSHTVTCLMFDRQEDIEQLKGVKIVRHKKFLPLLE